MQREFEVVQICKYCGNDCHERRVPVRRGPEIAYRLRQKSLRRVFQIEREESHREKSFPEIAD